MTSKALARHRDLFDPACYEKSREEAEKKYYATKEAESDAWNQRGILKVYPTEHSTRAMLGRNKP